MTKPAPQTRLTVVRALAAGQVGVWVLLAAVFTAPGLRQALQFDPGITLSTRPWSMLTYPFVHDGPVHLAILAGLLLLVGPPVARRMGTRGFLLYWLYCSIGGVLAAMVASLMVPIPPLAGALAPTTGVALAWAWFRDPETFPLDPLPGRLSYRSLVVLAAIVAATLGLAVAGSALSVAHLGGLGAGYVFLRIRTREGPKPPVTPLPIRHVVLTRARERSEAELEAEHPTARSVEGPARRRAPRREAGAEEINRLLDKISAAGLESLTADERRLLSEYSERKRRERQG